MEEVMENIEYNPFAGCIKLKTIKYNGFYHIVEDNILYNGDKTEIITFPSGRTDEYFNIPEGVKRIGDSSFEGNTKLKTIIIPSSVTGIGKDAFKNSKRLKTVLYEGTDGLNCDNSFSKTNK